MSEKEKKKQAIEILKKFMNLNRKKQLAFIAELEKELKK